MQIQPGDRMKSRGLMLAVMVAASLCFSACGGGSSAPAPNPSNEWVWANGADVVNQRGTYGTQGTPAATNVPGARQNAMTWADKAGNLWLFGGYGYDSSGKSNLLNDLWQYN